MLDLSLDERVRNTVLEQTGRRGTPRRHTTVLDFMPFPQPHIAVSAPMARAEERTGMAPRVLAGIDLDLTGRLLAVALLISLIIITG